MYIMDIIRIYFYAICVCIYEKKKAVGTLLVKLHDLFYMFTLFNAAK